MSSWAFFPTSLTISGRLRWCWSAQVWRRIGKSSLLAAVIGRARGRGIEVLTAVGVQSETRLPFSGLHQLLQPIIPLAEGLPPRQRDALLAAFGMSANSAPELFLIALATLELISAKGESRRPHYINRDVRVFHDRGGLKQLFEAAAVIRRGDQHQRSCSRGQLGLLHRKCPFQTSRQRQP